MRVLARKNIRLRKFDKRYVKIARAIKVWYKTWYRLLSYYKAGFRNLNFFHSSFVLFPSDQLRRLPVDWIATTKYSVPCTLFSASSYSHQEYRNNFLSTG